MSTHYHRDAQTPLAALLRAALDPDWQQVALNGDPPCFHSEDGRFCLRAERWAGHDGTSHPYVSLAILLRYVIARTAQPVA